MLVTSLSAMTNLLHFRRIRILARHKPRSCMNARPAVNRVVRHDRRAQSRKRINQDGSVGSVHMERLIICIVRDTTILSTREVKELVKFR